MFYDLPIVLCVGQKPASTWYIQKIEIKQSSQFLVEHSWNEHFASYAIISKPNCEMQLPNNEWRYICDIKILIFGAVYSRHWAHHLRWKQKGQLWKILTVTGVLMFSEFLCRIGRNVRILRFSNNTQLVNSWWLVQADLLTLLYCKTSTRAEQTTRRHGKQRGTIILSMCCEMPPSRLTWLGMINRQQYIASVKLGGIWITEVNATHKSRYFTTAVYVFF